MWDKEVNMSEEKKVNTEHPDLVCPKCGTSIAWWNNCMDAYLCSSDWNGMGERGKPNPCRTCSNDGGGDRWDNFETEYSSSREIGANKH